MSRGRDAHPFSSGHRRWTVLAALLAFVFTTFGPTAALALARATSDAPIVVELCSSSGIKRVMLDGASANEPAKPQEDARPAPADCKYCKLLSATLAPPPGELRIPLDAGRGASLAREAQAQPPVDAPWRGASPRAPPVS